MSSFHTDLSLSQSTPGFGRRWLTHLAAFLAVGLPFLIGYGVIPLTNLTSEALSVVGFALILILLGQRLSASVGPVPVLTPASWGPLGLILAAVMVLVLSAALQFVVFGARNLDAYLVVEGYLLAAGVAACAGHLVARQSTESALWMQAMANAIVCGAILAALGSLAQYFGWDGRWAVLSPVSDAGRTYGFVRQPNQQATFLNLGLIALMGLHGLKRVGLLAWLAGSLLLIFAMVTTGSRTGLLQLAFIGGLCLVVNPLRGSWRLRAGMVAWLLVAGALVWATLFLVSVFGGHDFYGVQKLQQTSSEGVGVRLVLWQETLEMVLEHPWLGQGVTHFAPLFFLGGYAEKTKVLMSNSHNLVLQLAFDFGLPATLVTLALVAYVLWRGRRTLGPLNGFMVYACLGCLLIHSMLEFPLWYTYFLLPTAYWLGQLTAGPQPSSRNSTGTETGKVNGVVIPAWLRSAPIMAGLAMIGVAVSMNRDFYRLTPLYMPAPVEEVKDRVQAGQDVFWFKRFAVLPLLTTGTVTQENSRVFLATAAEVGCQMSEPWYQPNVMAALIYQNKLDEAKSIIYQHWRLSGKAAEQFKPIVQSMGTPAAKEILRYLDNPTPVPVRYDTFVETCMGGGTIY